MILLVAFQLAVAVPQGLAPSDSGKLIARVRDAEFSFLMDWRHEWETWRTDLFQLRRQLASKLAKLPPPPSVRQPIITSMPGHALPGQDLQTIRYDIDQHQAAAHRIPSVNLKYAITPWWVSPVDTEPIDEALGIDNPLPPIYREAVRARRRPLLALLDSAAHSLPADSWLAGQRVRMYVDQQEPPLALQAATECRAAEWWCLMLRGYVRFSARDAAGAAATFDTAVKRMPPETRCRWNDVSQLLTNTGSAAYAQLSCAQQDSVNARLWWLADPLYLVPTNDRLTDHYARRVLAELHAANDADEREDMRDGYTGPAFRSMVLRYGWPTTMRWNPPPDCGVRMGRLGTWSVSGCTFPVPPGLSRFDVHAAYLGPTGSLFIPEDEILAAFDRRLNTRQVYDTEGHAPPLNSTPAVPIAREAPWPAYPMYWGPQYHTIPAWSAINDPLHAVATDWDLGPGRQDTLVWDSSWWATEFYRRYEGPLVDLSTQIGFLRRQATAEIAAAMDWPTATTFLAPPTHAVVGVITSGGPAERPQIVSMEVNGAHPDAILTPVESRPLLLGVEMVPANNSGAAARTRFGVAPPQPLSALAPHSLALSDVLLVRATPNDSFPTSIEAALPRMYGSTQLLNPARLAIFWEVYGQNDGDTVDVALRIVRRSDAGALSRAAAAVGFGHAGDDSITVRWREPRSGDPLALADGGVSIRPRGFALDVSGLAAGAYALTLRIDRKDTSATSTAREFTIVRR